MISRSLELKIVINRLYNNKHKVHNLMRKKQRSAFDNGQFFVPKNSQMTVRDTITESYHQGHNRKMSSNVPDSL